MAQVRLFIESLGPHGDGIAHSARGPVYVDRTAPGDDLEALIKKDAKGIYRGEAISFHQLSEQRASPSCPHYDDCGNCNLQHLSQKYYRNWKLEKVKQALKKVRLNPEQWLDPVFLDGKNRRRVTFSLTRRRGQLVMGYYKRRSQQISAIHSCEIALPELMELKAWLEPFLAPLISEGTCVDFFVQKVGNYFDAVLIGPKNFPRSLLNELASFDPIGRLSVKTPKGIQVIHDKHCLIAEFGVLKVVLPPASFLQPTLEGEQTLTQSVVAAIPEVETIADLFSGAGTFTGPLLSRGAVSAFESNTHAVQALKSASSGHALSVFQRDLFLKPLSAKELNQFDAIVFDPPRAGCVEQASNMAKSHCSILVGVSCNPATFARDAQILVRGGFKLKTLQVIDQFLWSSHVEIIGVFHK